MAGCTNLLPKTMSLTAEEITHIARLSRLKTDPEEAQAYAGQLSKIMDLIEQMNQIDVSGVEPMSHPQDAALRLRDDEVTKTNQRETFQSIAPSVEDGLYLVPKVID